MIEKHDLINELPEYSSTIESLRGRDKNFTRLFDKYHELDDEVRKIEEGKESAEEEYLDARKKERLELKDELFEILKEASQSTQH